MKSRPRYLPQIPHMIIFATGAIAGSLLGWMVARSGDSIDPLAETAARSGSRAGTHSSATSAGSRVGGPADRRNSGSRSAMAAESAAFAQSVRAIFRDSNEDRRLKMFGSLLEKCTLDHYEVIVSLVRENDLRGCGSGKEWSLLWSNWGMRDPVGGMEFITGWDWSGWHPHAAVEAKNRTVMNCAQTDPEAARRFVDRAVETDPGDRALVEGLVRGLATVDPQVAAEWLFQSGLGRGGKFRTVVEAISRNGGHEALDERLEGSSIVFTTARAYAERDPVAAMDRAARSQLPQAATVAMNVWARQDPDAAAAWTRDNPDSPLHSLAVQLLESQLGSQEGASDPFAE